MQSEKRVKRTLADGSVKTYSYTRGGLSVWTVGKTIAAYKASAGFKRLADRTRVQYARNLDLLKALDAVPIATVRRRHIRAIRDELSETPGSANEFVKVARCLMSFALEDDIIEFNPLVRFKNLPIGEYQPWTDAQIAAMKKLPEYLRRAAVLALYTGQRESDTRRMSWADYDGQTIRVVQQKTGARLWIPCHSELRAELDKWERQAVTILTTSLGRPWATANSLATRFWRVTRTIPELSGVVYHGLRKTAAVRLAEAGCSTHEIAAITGHRSLAMIQHYTKDASQKRNAVAAIFRLENGRKLPSK